MILGTSFIVVMVSAAILYLIGSGFQVFLARKKRDEAKKKVEEVGKKIEEINKRLEKEIQKLPKEHLK